MRNDNETDFIHRALFDEGTATDPLESEDWISQDIHCVSALVKSFFRELPRPLVPGQAHQLLREAAVASETNSDSRESLDHYRRALYSLSRVQYR